MILPPLEMYCFFHMDNLLWSLFSTPSQATMDLYEATNGNPK